MIDTDLLIGADTAHVHCLYYGSGRAPVARVVPDGRYPGMWRIAWGAGFLSDMVNLTRAKDAAAALAVRGPRARDARRLHWKQDRLDSRSEASPACSFEPPLPEGRIATDEAVA
jgi:hypothetical protein